MKNILKTKRLIIFSMTDDDLRKLIDFDNLVDMFSRTERIEDMFPSTGKNGGYVSILDLRY